MSGRDPKQAGRKNVAIVGGGIAGALLAKLVQNHAQVTLIDPYACLSLSLSLSLTLCVPLSLSLYI